MRTDTSHIGSDITEHDSCVHSVSVVQQIMKSRICGQAIQYATHNQSWSGLLQQLHLLLKSLRQRFHPEPLSSEGRGHWQGTAQQK